MAESDKQSDYYLDKLDDWLVYLRKDVKAKDWDHLKIHMRNAEEAFYMAYSGLKSGD